MGATKRARCYAAARLTKTQHIVRGGTESVRVRRRIRSRRRVRRRERQGSRKIPTATTRWHHVGVTPSQNMPATPSRLILPSRSLFVVFLFVRRPPPTFPVYIVCARRAPLVYPHSKSGRVSAAALVRHAWARRRRRRRYAANAQ